MTRFREGIIFLVPALALGAVLTFIGLSGTDQRIFLWVNEHAQIFGDLFWQCATLLGDGLVVIVLVLPFTRSRPSIPWNTLLSSLIVLAVVQGIKQLDGSARPMQVLPSDSFSVIGPPLRSMTFPSGHAATAFMLAGIFWLYFRQAWARVAVVAAAVLIATSRIAVGVHWPVDSLAGGIIGWLAAGIGFYLTAVTRYVDHWVTRLVLQVTLSGCALSLFVYDHTSYADAFRFQQIIAAVCLTILFAQIIRDQRSPLPDQASG